MHVLVATDGTLDTDAAAKFAVALAGPKGKATVATIVKVPRTLVQELRHQWSDPATIHVDMDGEYVGAPNVESAIERSYPGDDAVVEQYLGNKRVAVCKPVAEAIRASGVVAESVVREGDDVEDEIMSLADEIDAELIIVGSHGHNAFQGLLGSTGAKLVRRSPVPVLVIR
jgi:nucleotide-binding universal stress UspA family protein